MVLKELEILNFKMFEHLKLILNYSRLCHECG